MNKLVRVMLAWLLLFSLMAPAWAEKKTKRAPDSAPKTVKVKSYTKKNGKTVKAHERRAPEKK